MYVFACGLWKSGLWNPESHYDLNRKSKLHSQRIGNPESTTWNPVSKTVFTWGEKRQLGPTQGVPFYPAVCLIEVSVKRESTVYGGV